MIEIEIDGKPLQVEQGAMIIEAADAAGIYIPRFCYHKKLSIAANCRMCLVEVEKAPKPLPACATPVTAGMKVLTASSKAKESQRAVMEFLLINHPLDCPICDQGGECELQDLSLGYGNDVSQYTEGKRSVVDEDIGPLIETEMTRCIQCTRCVRFGTEIAGIRELGATGRGEQMRIGTYVKHSLQSELAGNIIDLCPVGALTSKPYRYTARAWELEQMPSIAPHDCVGSNIYVHQRRQQVMRVVPRENEALNETWISDRDRFSYLGLNSPDRLQKPLIKRDGQWQETDWLSALAFVTTGLQKVIAQHSAQQIAALISPSATLEECYLLQKLMRGLGSHNIDHRLQQTDVADQQAAPLLPTLGVTLAELEEQDGVLLIGADVQREAPIIGHRLRKAVGKGGHVLGVNLIDYAFNFEQQARTIVTPQQLCSTLAAIAKQLAERSAVTLTAAQQQLLEGHASTVQAAAIAEHLLAAGPRKLILLGAVANNHPQAATVRYLARLIATLSAATFGTLTAGANSAGAWLAGAVPHRAASGAVVQEPGLAAQAALAAQLRAYILFNIEPELDCANGYRASAALAQADFVVALSAFKTEQLLASAHVILPLAAFTENEGTLINAAGQQQNFRAAVPPMGESKLGWKILRVLGNELGLTGFEYNTVVDVSAEFDGSAQSSKLVQQEYQPASIDAAPALTSPTLPSMLMRITEWPLYAIDSLVRRAGALQESAVQTVAAVHINPQLASARALVAGESVLVKQATAEMILPVMLDARVPPNCVWIPAGMAATANLGEPFGTIELSRCVQV